MKSCEIRNVNGDKENGEDFYECLDAEIKERKYWQLKTRFLALDTGYYTMSFSVNTRKGRDFVVNGRQIGLRTFWVKYLF